MLLDFDVKSCTRECASTGRALAPGERFYSTLVLDGLETIRRDYSKEAWEAPPERTIGWWQARVPDPTDAKAKLAPNDVLLNLLIRLTDNADELELRYVVALLLVRRRVLQIEESRHDADGLEVMVTSCPRRSEQYEVVVADPDDAAAEKLQQRVADLLYAGD